MLYETLIFFFENEAKTRLLECLGTLNSWKIQIVYVGKIYLKIHVS